MRGARVLKTWVGTQATVALRSAEAELVSLARGAAEGLGLHSLAGDLGQEARLRVRVDSSAVIGICSRTGVGKVRHLDTRLLWVQELVRDRRLIVQKVPGEANPADLLTKHLGAELISAHRARMSCWEREGRAQLAPSCV